MTDKTIINNVDVSGCICLAEWKHCDICQTLIKTIDRGDGKMRSQCVTQGDSRCEFYPNCFYKQLQREKQKVRELENKLECRNDMLKMLQDRTNTYLAYLGFTDLEKCTLWTQTDQIFARTGTITDKYKQALEEIKGIASRVVNSISFGGSMDVYFKELNKQILQKCEVLEDE